MKRRLAESQDTVLGMDRPISRRDFLQGMAAGLAVAAAPGCRSAASPAARPGPVSGARPPRPASGRLAGQDDAAMELGHVLRGGADPDPSADDTGEEVDLVVVGAGIAGLATAYLYDRERGGRARVLLLDVGGEPGGHARRNTFDLGGQTLVAHGGTYALEEVEEASAPAQALLGDVGVDLERLRGYRDERVYPGLGLSRAVFFDPRHYPGIQPTWVDCFYDTRYEDFFARAPIPEPARRELVALYTSRRRYLPRGADLERALAGMSWERFIREVMGLGDEAVRFADLYAADLVGLGCDAVTALKGFWYGPGFFGMGGTGFRERDGIIQYAYDASFRYPDGNHTVARHFLKKLVPDAIAGEDSMEGVFNGRFHTERLDRPGQQIRLRLRSAAVRVIEGGRAGYPVAVNYQQADGRVRRVHARGAVVAAWGMVAKHIVPAMGEAQRAALAGYKYCACLYINVVLRHWRPIADVGAFSMQMPGGYCTWMEVADPLSVGPYRPRYHPDSPTVLSMYKYIYSRGLPPAEQMRRARRELEGKTFADHEREIRAELLHMFGRSGFDPRDDILAITVNRWGHAYNFFPPTPGKQPPYERGRQAVGRISFAGADAGGIPWTMAALDQADRAAREQLRLG